ncbi:MAG: HD domain-containing protein [Acidobacteriaceae bacterium]|nr:HD domain-containing protein [Acidobacteriaceae bacterium]MBV9085619.1 HD domain-containing protein [Acidobacteriaceae bacterium]
MKSPYVGTLVPNDVVTAQFLVLTKEIRQKKTGEPYLSLHLADRTGEIEAKMWDNVGEVMHTFDGDDFVKVKGLVQVYQNRWQFTVHRLRRLEDHEVDPADFFPCSECDPEQMYSELEGIICGISNSHLRGLLQALFADPQIAKQFKIAPAAKNIHHACRGGLLEHVLSLCKLCRSVGQHYADIDLDLLITGAILHDIGKIEELSYARSFGYSAEGQLLGHIVIGLRIVGEKVAVLPDFPPKLRSLVEHMIISHHGELQFGSPKVPVFREAMLLHHLDNLDSKMEALKNALKRDAHMEGEFTGWVGSLERSILRKDRYMADRAGTPVAPILGSDITVEVPPSHPVSVTVAHEAGEPPQRPDEQGTAPPEASIPKPPERPEQKPVPMTLFGEKLQAVLESRK